MYLVIVHSGRQGKHSNEKEHQQLRIENQTCKMSKYGAGQTQQITRTTNCGLDTRRESIKGDEPNQTVKSHL